MIEDKEFIGQIFKQNCGDSLLVLKKTDKRNSTGILFKCKFQKYPYEILANKKNIINGSVNNPQIEQVEFIDKIWPQNCGDSLKVIEKVNIKGKSLFRCQFQKYFYEVLVKKSQILSKSVLNPQIEQVEFIDKIWPQNCGDSLKIIEKTNIKDKFHNVLYRATFIKYPYEILKCKYDIIRGENLNPLIEENEFIGKEFLQNCGDILKVLRKTNEFLYNKYRLFECEFQKYPYKIKSIKQFIIKGNVPNPLIINEKEKEFRNKIYKQFCRDSLKILDFDNKSRKYIVEFINYPYKTKAFKYDIIRGEVRNLFLEEEKRRENFINLCKSYPNKPTILELSKKINKTPSFVGKLIFKYSAQEYINYKESLEEKSLADYISQYIYTERKKWDINQEIDVYIPSLNIGFEYNGAYWHSELYKSPNYHQDKKIKSSCPIFYIWSWEWNNPILKEKIKQYIKNKLNIFEQKISARKCEIKKLTNKEYQDFCELYHLQGYKQAKIRLGLFYKDELIQILSFSKSRFNKNYDWEIIRSCIKKDIIVIGGIERLWSYFVKNYSPKNCISYCDFSKFDGNSYLKLGFKKERLNKPGFWWLNEKFTDVYWRNPYKHKEMKEKYIKIYDAGQLVFVWKNLQ